MLQGTSAPRVLHVVQTRGLRPTIDDTHTPVSVADEAFVHRLTLRARCACTHSDNTNSLFIRPHKLQRSDSHPSTSQENLSWDCGHGGSGREGGWKCELASHPLL